ncbi:hypothetical protein B0O95_11286 [Mycetohabitans endofungorum]|uniref:Uncharacterized protein n=1 Tax=Mycetohabitans endofungorum TaxID=417203 RepID=A0A2P5K858_9BURK|nr:hypothetical protein B0O95_11286 [Mycetohabitans endofungorum]
MVGDAFCIVIDVKPLRYWVALAQPPFRAGGRATEPAPPEPAVGRARGGAGCRVDRALATQRDASGGVRALLYGPDAKAVLIAHVPRNAQFYWFGDVPASGPLGCVAVARASITKLRCGLANSMPRSAKRLKMRRLNSR